MTWESICRSDEVHVWPLNDTIAHEWSDCACIPFLEAIPRQDGSFGWLITHNAWDGRK